MVNLVVRMVKCGKSGCESGCEDGKVSKSGCEDGKV